MDPTRCWQEMNDALRRGRLTEAQERASDLLEWLSKGGVLPAGAVLMSRSDLMSQCRAILRKEE
jgi:hypothetical protein